MPLLVLAGTEYAEMPFQELHDRLCSALRGTRPRLALEVFQRGGTATLVFEDGFTRPITVVNDSTTSSSSSEDAGQRREEGRIVQITISEGVARSLRWQDLGIDIDVSNL